MIFLKVMLDQWFVREEKTHRPSLVIYKTVFLSLKLFSHTIVDGQEKEE